MNNSNLYVDLSTREAEFLKNIRRKSYVKGFALAITSLSIILTTSSAYFDKKLTEKTVQLELEIAKNKDLKIANQRAIEENKQVSVEKYLIGSVYSIEKNAPALDQSISNLNQDINSNTLNPAFEVYGAIYEQLANAVERSNNAELKNDIASILVDGVITFDEYRNLRQKHDLDEIMDQYEANKLRETIDAEKNK